jgi:4-amino-4-deoxy-L-arabinose transferase-like glycosyltransferase
VRDAAPRDADAARWPRGAWLDTVLLAAAAAVLFGAGIGDYPLWDPGEGRNAQAAREMARAGAWLVPRIYGEPYYDKPAPFFWLLSAFQSALGDGEIAVRLPSVLATLGTLAVLHRFALRSFGRRVAALAAVIHATSPEVVALARFCNFDATLTFFLTTASIGWLAWLDGRRRFPLVPYVAMGLGALVKGPVAILLPVLVLVACAGLRREIREVLRAARPLAGACVVGALVLPWIGAAAAEDPRYVETFLVGHNVERYLSSEYGHARGLLFYLPVVLGGMFPWSLLLPAAALAPRGGTRREREVLAWAVVVLGFFTLADAKLATYVLPAFPPLALWLALRVDGILRAEGVPGRVARLVRGAVGIWAGVLVVLPVALASWLWSAYPELLRGALWAAPLPLVAWLGARLVLRGTLRPLAACAAFAAANAYLLGVFYLGAAPLVSRVASDADIARLAHRLAPQATIVGFRIQPASLSYYARAPVRRANLPEEVRAAAREGPLLIVTRRRHEALLREAGVPLYVWLDTRRHLLYATIPAS